MARVESLLKVLACVVATSSAMAMEIIDQGQGTHLHGTGDFEHVNIPLRVDGQPNCKVSFNKGNLQLSHGCLPLEGTTFTAPYEGGAVTFTIQGVLDHTPPVSVKKPGVPSPVQEAPVPKRPMPPRNDYVVRVSKGGTDGSNLCAGPNRALAIPHAWSTSGELLDDPPGGTDSFTFACLPFRDNNGVTKGGGVIAKCVDWGYPPWEDPSVSLDTTFDPNPGYYDADSAKRFHQTCVRMATADYCGEGNANTVDGTPISSTDATNLGSIVTINPPPMVRFAQTWPAGPTRYLPPLKPEGASKLESIWGIDGCGRARVLCLSRARWDTLSLAGTCVDGVMAKRIMTPPSLGTGACARKWTCDGSPDAGTWEAPLDCKQCASCSPVYRTLEPGSPGTCDSVQPPGICELWTTEDLKKRGATLFTYSKSWDKAFVSFTADDGRKITTSVVTHDEPQPGQDELNSFKLDSGIESGFSRPFYEGKIFGASMSKSLRTSLGVELSPIYRCKKGNRYLTTNALKPDGKTCVTEGYVLQGGGPEGWIYATQPPDRESVPLFLWRREDHGDISYATTRADLTPYQYQRVMQLGYLVLRSRLAYHAP